MRYIWAIMLIIVIVAGIWYVNNHDIPGIGDSHIAFTMEDGRNGQGWSKNFYEKDYQVSWDDIVFARIINPSPQSYVLKLTNMDTGQEFTVRHREILSGDHYKVTRKSLDGKVISTHELTIHHH